MRSDEGRTTCAIVNARVAVKDDAGNWRPVPVEAMFEIDHAGLGRLVDKAYRNKLRRAKDGPLIVRTLKGGGT